MLTPQDYRTLTVKKVNYIFKSLNLDIIVDKLFSCVGNSWRKESQAEENRYLIWTAEQTEVGSAIPLDTRNTLIIFLSAISVMQVIFRELLLFFWWELIQKLINEQRVIFYNPSNVSCSSDKFMQIKHLKHHSSIVMCSSFTLFNLQIMNFCLWRHIES